MELRFETAGAETVLPLEHQAPQEDLALQAVKAELDEIVGLTAVKDYILSLEDNFKMQQLRKERGLKADSPSMHMIFTGNPGTGKTTVARIVSRYLKASGPCRGASWWRWPGRTWWASTWATPPPSPKRPSRRHWGACCSSTRPTPSTGGRTTASAWRPSTPW